MGRIHVLGAVAMVIMAARPAAGFVHGWDTVGDMLGSNLHAAYNGRYNAEPRAMKHWEWIANNYAVVVVGRFEDFNPPAGYACMTKPTSVCSDVDANVASSLRAHTGSWIECDRSNETHAATKRGARLSPADHP
jgi:hypothetical protein